MKRSLKVDRVAQICKTDFCSFFQICGLLDYFPVDNKLVGNKSPLIVICGYSCAGNKISHPFALFTVQL